MTPIRPNLPSPLPGAAPSNAASARAAFFQAMNGAAAATPVAPAAPVQKAVSAAVAPTQAAAPQPDPTRPLRPGSLLDIRV
jgi:hypothetical protein